jgi:hypothetical protein
VQPGGGKTAHAKLRLAVEGIEIAAYQNFAVGLPRQRVDAVSVEAGLVPARALVPVHGCCSTTGIDMLSPYVVQVVYWR